MLPGALGKTPILQPFAVSKVDEVRFILHQTGQSPAAGCRKGQNRPRRTIQRLVRQCLRYQQADACLRYALAHRGFQAGFALHAYEYREGSNGNGIIWVVPADAPLVAPGECPRLEDTWLQPPQPPGAVGLMEAIEGDGSPWSYLSASILCREAAEFGAAWHGCVWSDQTILSKPPRQADGQDTSDDALKLTGDAPVGNWTWHGAAPRTWKPTYIDRGTTKEVVLHIHDPIGQEKIYRATDTYPAGSYDGKTKTTVLSTGDRCIVY